MTKETQSIFLSGKATINHWLIWTVFIFLGGLLVGCISQPEAFDYQMAKRLESEGWQKVPQILSGISPPSFPDRDFNVREYGAKGDSLTNDLEAFQKAINAAAENGGLVKVPPGQYFLAGPLHLKSKVNLNIHREARLFFTSDAERYLPAVKVRWEGTVCYNYSPLIYGYRLTDVAITGYGEINGNGKKWSTDWRKLQKEDKDRLRQMGNDTIPEHQRVFGHGFLDLNWDGSDDGYGDGQPHYLRPPLIELYECKNILIENLTLKNSPFWTVHPVFSTNITIRGLKISGETLNDDGIDPDSCADVLIESCNIQTRDDAISIKAGRDQDAWQRKGSRNIIIRDNRLLSGANALCVGSEMSGGVENVFAENNFIAQGTHALNFKCNLDRGGQVKNIYLRNTEIESCKAAMFIFRMDYHGYRGNNFPTKFNDFFISNISCQKVEEKPFKIVGVEEEPIRRIMFDSVSIGQAGEESEIRNSHDLIFHQVVINQSSFAYEP